MAIRIVYKKIKLSVIANRDHVRYPPDNLLEKNLILE